MAFFGDTKEARASVYFGGLPQAFSLAEGECDVGAGEWLVVRVEFAVVGSSAASGGSAGCGG